MAYVDAGVWSVTAPAPGTAAAPAVAAAAAATDPGGLHAGGAVPDADAASDGQAWRNLASAFGDFLRGRMDVRTWTTRAADIASHARPIVGGATEVFVVYGAFSQEASQRRETVASSAVAPRPRSRSPVGGISRTTGVVSKPATRRHWQSHSASLSEGGGATA